MLTKAFVSGAHNSRFFAEFRFCLLWLELVLVAERQNLLQNCIPKISTQNTQNKWYQEDKEHNDQHIL